MNKSIRLITTILLVAATAFVQSCITEDTYESTPRGVLEALWKTMDENYCFFQEKKDSFGVDWDDVHAAYASRVDDAMDNYQLFDLCAEMLNELRDGHVNLIASHDVSAYGAWADAYPANYSDTLERIYLGKTGEYRVSAGIRYRVLKNNVGYMRVESFANAIGNGNLGEIMQALAPCSGLIVDIRSNSGGLLTSAEKLASAFYDEETIVGYIAHKTGRGRGDFSTPTPISLSPFVGLRWQKPFVVLTNRSVYSAANSFVAYVRYAPGVTIMGDRTGGGGGMPLTKELPNGWAVRMSASPLYDAKMNSIESGIFPDVGVGLTNADFLRGIDTMIEAASELLLQKAAE